MWHCFRRGSRYYTLCSRSCNSCLPIRDLRGIRAMILPTKHIPTERSLLGIGSILLSCLDQPHTITSLWDRTHTIPEIATFERFVLALDLLYTIGVIDIQDGLLRKNYP